MIKESFGLMEGLANSYNIVGDFLEEVIFATIRGHDREVFD